jgi:hypothetical protein
MKKGAGCPSRNDSRPLTSTQDEPEQPKKRKPPFPFVQTDAERNRLLDADDAEVRLAVEERARRYTLHGPGRCPTNDAAADIARNVMAETGRLFVQDATGRDYINRHIQRGIERERKRYQREVLRIVPLEEGHPQAGISTDAEDLETAVEALRMVPPILRWIELALKRLSPVDRALVYSHYGLAAMDWSPARDRKLPGAEARPRNADARRKALGRALERFTHRLVDELASPDSLSEAERKLLAPLGRRIEEDRSLEAFVDALSEVVVKWSAVG